jgi:hypothetical protein
MKFYEFSPPHVNTTGQFFVTRHIVLLQLVGELSSSQDFGRPFDLYEHHHVEKPTALPPQFGKHGSFFDNFMGNLGNLPPPYIPTKPLISPSSHHQDSFIGKLIDTPPRGLPHQSVYQDAAAARDLSEYNGGKLPSTLFSFDEMSHAAFMPKHIHQPPFAPPPHLFQMARSQRRMDGGVGGGGGES